MDSDGERSQQPSKKLETGVSPSPSARQLLLREPLQETEAQGNPQRTAPELLPNKSVVRLTLHVGRLHKTLVVQLKERGVTAVV